MQLLYSRCVCCIAGTQQHRCCCWPRLSSSYTQRNRHPINSATASATSPNIASSSSNSTSHSKSEFLQQPWRWFGFDTETTGLNIERDCVIQLAVIDLESGESFHCLVTLHFINLIMCLALKLTSIMVRGSNNCWRVN